MKNSFRILGLLALLTLTLTGTGGCTWIADLPFALTPTVPVPSATPSSPLPSPTVAPTATPSTSPQGITLELWVPEFLSPYEEGSAAAATFAAQLLSFETSYTYRDVRITTVVKKDTGTGGLYSLLSTASQVAPSVLPDVLVLNQHDLIAAASEGLLQPLDDELPLNHGYYTTTLSVLQNSQGLWGFPYLAHAEQLAYRETLTDTLPLTWSGMVSGSHSLLLPAAPSDGLSGDALLQMYLGSGGRVMDATGQASLERASLERMYRFLFDLYGAGLLNAERALELPSTGACWTLYQDGTGDISPVSFGQFWPDPPEGSRPAWAPTADGEPVTVLYTWGVAVVTPDPVRREVALQLARWLISATRMAELAEAAELVPTRRMAVDEWELNPEELAFVDTLLSHGLPALPPSVDTPVRRALQAGLVAMLQGEVDTPEAAASAALTAQRR